MHSCAVEPHAGAGFTSAPSEMGEHPATIGASMVTDCTHGTPEHKRPGESAPSAVQSPAHPAGASQSMEAAPIPGHFAADACICVGSSQPDGAHVHEGHDIGEGSGSAWSLTPGATAFKGQGGGSPGPIQNMERSSKRADFHKWHSPSQGGALPWPAVVRVAPPVPPPPSVVVVVELPPASLPPFG